MSSKGKHGTRHLATYAAVAVCALQLLLLLLSWLVTAAWPELPLRSLLGSEGIRWMLGRLPTEVAKSGIVSLLLLCMAVGAARKSGLSGCMKATRRYDYRSRMAFRLVVAGAVLSLVGLLFLTAVPHAILLSVSGEVFPSNFSQNIVPCLSSVITLLSLTYGLVSGRLRTLADCFHAVCFGFQCLAHLIVLYLLAASLFRSLCFVMIW